MSAASTSATTPALPAPRPTSFKVPHGLSSAGVLVRREDAIKGEEYRCPSCFILLVIHEGAKKAKHFAHAPAANCAPETVLHKTAKRLVVEQIDGWKRGERAAPMVRRQCRRCSGYEFQKMSPDVTAAMEEQRVAETCVADVALFKGPDVAAVIEILVTNPVTPQKADTLDAATLLWIEVSAEDVCASGASLLLPLVDHFRPLNRCRECRDSDELLATLLPMARARVDAATKEAKAAFEQRKRELRKKADALVAQHPEWRAHPPFVGLPEYCFKCHQNVVVYTWPGHEPYARWSPKRNRPATMLWGQPSPHAFPNYAYNTCPICGTLMSERRCFEFALGPFARWSDAAVPNLAVRGHDKTSTLTALGREELSFVASVRQLLGRKRANELRREIIQFYGVHDDIAQSWLDGTGWDFGN